MGVRGLPVLVRSLIRSHERNESISEVVEFTAQHHSCLESDPEIVVELTRAGAKINACTRDFFN